MQTVPLMLTAFLAVAPEAGVQRVVAAIARAARENAAKPEAERATGDALADLYVRRACASGQPARAVALGIGYALDLSGTLAGAGSVLAGEAFKDVETAEERKARLAVMGRPTMRGREDWLAHFVVSAALTVLVGEPTAEAAAIQKEVSDAARKEEGHGSGFSFSDLNADLAGIVFAKWLSPEPQHPKLAACARSFETARFLPDPKDLPDGLTRTDFEQTWGGVQSPRFRAECRRLRELALECEGYRRK